MEFASVILDIIPGLWRFGQKHANYLCHLKTNLEELKMALEELKNCKEDVNERVIADESRLLRRIHLVDGWLQSVAAIEVEVDIILRSGSEQIQGTCFGGRCPRRCWTSYKLSKTASKKLANVNLLKSREFVVVATPPPPPPVQEMVEATTFGLEMIFAKAWGFLGADDISVIGLYGMGGTGKTTLLKKINNEFLKNCGFDLVIWVVISKEVNMRSVQTRIGERLGFFWLESNDMESRAVDLFNVLKGKRFVILMDDIWESIDLSSIGIPIPDSKNKSKLVFTTRSEVVCGGMKANETVKVNCLTRDQAWSLFQSRVGEKTISCHPGIMALAQSVAEECGGLPLALIVIGGTMACKKTPQEWKYALDTLRKQASAFSGMEDKVYSVLKFSYDYLPNDCTRSCFIFCSLYPEDNSIYVEHLIEKWIGSGYIGSDEFEKAVNTGHHIIGTLKATCLLDDGENDDKSFVKMHDVLREMAQWIARDSGMRHDSILVSTGQGVRRVPKITECAERVSFTYTGISQLDVIPHCPQLSTLLLFQNPFLNHIHDDFFLLMPALRFLDLSHTGITKLPASIASLVLLEHLDLSNTQIKELPMEMEALRSLKYLFLESTEKLKKIPRGLIRGLSNLRMVKVSDTNFGDNESDMLAGIEELGILSPFYALSIKISNPRVKNYFLGRPPIWYAEEGFWLKMDTC